MAAFGWRTIKELGLQLPHARKWDVDRMLILPSGGNVHVRSADDPDSLRGEGLDFVVLDECAFMKEITWSHVLRPSLSDREGRALFISTPKGRNWFWRLWQRGQDDKYQDWASWSFKTAENPFIQKQEIETARFSLPQMVFAQEYLGEFLADAGGVFRKVVEAATAEEQQNAQEGHSYVMGVDWGKYQDFTVFTIFDTTEKSVIYMDRFNQIDYTVQVGRLKVLYDRFKPRLIAVERNSIGDPLIEVLERDGLPIEPFLTTNASKANLIDELSLAFERGHLRILPDPVLVGELQAYEATRLPSGMLRYSAPNGIGDDTVISLALAVWASKQRTSRPEAVAYPGRRAGSIRKSAWRDGDIRLKHVDTRKSAWQDDDTQLRRVDSRESSWQ
jgi:hypothetical protein